MSQGNFGAIQDSISSDQQLAILDHLNNGNIFYLKDGDIENAYQNFRLAIDLAEKKDEKVLVCEAAKGILGIYERFVKSVQEDTYVYFIDLHRKNAYDDYEREFNSIYDYRIKLRSSHKSSRREIRTKYQRTNKDVSELYQDLQTKLFLTNSAYHFKITEHIDSSYYYFQLAQESSLFRRGYFAREDSMNIRIHKSILLDKQEQSNYAIENLKSLEIPTNSGFIFRLLETYKYYWLYTFSKNVNNDEDYEKFKSLYERTDFELNDLQVRQIILEMEVNNQINEMQIRVRNVYFETISLIVFLVLVSLFLLNNSRKKRLIAVQERELETQKNLNLLKEQEISTINAMVEGQEKERQLVAEDLHDNLGSALATLKLHIENLRLGLNKKKVDPEKLLDKAEDLIEDAYQKVRSIAHAKNSGVIANEGLLVAVNLMADKISAANSIEIDVIHFGLEKPLENSLEISLFRIIQELTTNIIKHANAKHATINISQDEEGITLLVEDDGVGMKTSQIKSTQGMGLHSIETRVEHLNGSFTIDSTPTKGTTVIIQIPS
jgi:signal transduction histidine kinase